MPLTSKEPLIMKTHYTAISLACSISLLHAQSEESETIVTANRYEQNKNDASASVSLIDESRFSLLRPQSLDDVLRGEPSIEFTGGPRITGEQLEIRGQGGNAVTVRIDNARQNFVSGHAGQRFFVDPFFLKSAEVIRGAKSHLYGSGAGGVVNLRSFTPSDLINPETGYGAKIQAGYQGVNDEVGYSGLYALGNDRLSFLLGYADRTSNDIQLGNGLESEGSAIDRQSVLFKANYSPSSDHEFTLGYNYYESQDTNGANPQADTNISNALVDRDITFHQFSIGHHWAPEDNDLIDLQSTFYFNQTNQTRSYLDDTGSNLDRENEHILETFGLDIANRSSYSAFGAENTLVAGLEYYTDEQEGNESRDTFFGSGGAGTSSGRPDAESDNFAIYLENTSEWDNGLSLAAGIRYDYYKTDGTTTDHQDSQVSPHIGIRYEVIDGLSFYGDYARAFTTPTLNQLYQDGSHFGVVPLSFFPSTVYFEELFIPNDDLDPESSQNFEIGVDFEREIHNGLFDAKVVWFHKKGKDTFDSEIVGGQTVNNFFGFAGPGTLEQAFRQTVNRNETTIQGIEADLNYTADNWHARVTYSYLDGEDDDTGEKLNTIPGNKLFLEVGYTIKEELTVGVNALFVGSREDKVSDETLATSAYDIYGVYAQWDYSENLSLTLGVNNILDQAYERTNVTNTESGRNVYLGASYSF